MNAYCDRHRLCMDDVCFHFGGKLLTATQTADDVDMQNDAVVDTAARPKILPGPLHTLDADMPMSICRFLSGIDIYRLAHTVGGV